MISSEGAAAFAPDPKHNNADYPKSKSALRRERRRQRAHAERPHDVVWERTTRFVWTAERTADVVWGRVLGVDRRTTPQGARETTLSETTASATTPSAAHWNS